jgi:3-oxoacyl-[acyl-carrier protein] reductase
MLITGTSKGIGRHLVHHYINQEFEVVGCSRSPVDYDFPNYQHFCLNITDEPEVKKIFRMIQAKYNRLDVLLNNAAIMSTNYALLTPLKTVQEILNTNISGTFLLCREAGKLMQKNLFGRIVNFSSMSVRLKIEGEAVYAASKAAIITLSEILAKELARFNITVNVIGPNLIETGIIASLPKEKKQALIELQAIHRLGELKDITNVVDFFIKPESDFITGQVIYLGGI